MAVVRRVFGTLFDGPLLLRATGTWFLVLVAVGAMKAAIGSEASGLAPFGSALISVLNVVVEFIALAACAVNIHRTILLDELPTPARASGLEWRYIKRLLWVTLPFGGIVTLIVVPLSFTGSLDFLRTLSSQPLELARFSVATGVLFYIVLAPPMLSLAAVAIGRSEFGIRAGYAAVRGNYLRLFAIYVLSGVIPPQFLRFVAIGLRDGLLLLAPAASFLAKVGVAAIQSAESVASTVMWAAMLSCVYGGLVEGRRDFIREASENSGDSSYVVNS